MTTAGASEKLSAFFVELKYGDPAAPSYLRLTDFTSDLTYQSLTYTSMPELEIRGLEISGIMDSDKPLQLVFQLLDSTIIDKASNGEQHSPIFIQLWEKLFSTSGGQDQVLTWFKGKMIRAVRNYQGRGKFVLFEFFGVKQRLGVAMGIIATHQCQWPFGARGCRAVVASADGTMTTAAGKSAVITGLPGHIDRFWHRGFVARAGLRIGIRDWLSGTSFELLSDPPAEWIGQTVKVYEGCDKTIERCREKGKEDRFSGFGCVIPAYSPNFEDV